MIDYPEYDYLIDLIDRLEARIYVLEIQIAILNNKEELSANHLE
jgi:hypothetical protein